MCRDPGDDVVCVDCGDDGPLLHRYLTDAPGELPGQWSGRQADLLGPSGNVSTEALERLLSGHDPVSDVVLGLPFTDRTLANGKVIRAVAGFDATVSAPKSLSVLWALTGDVGFAECHDVAVQVVLNHVERFGSTTRVRSNGGRLHPGGCREAPRFWRDEVENARHRTTLPCRSCRSSGLTVDASAICDHGSRASSAQAVGGSGARRGSGGVVAVFAAPRAGWVRLAWCSARRRTLAAASSATIARGPQSRSIGIIPIAVNKRRVVQESR